MTKTRMLRDWNGESNELIILMLEQYGIKSAKVGILKYEALSPDSFFWCLTVKSGDLQGRYFLYAEDYVTELQHVIETINENLTTWNPNDTPELMPVKNRIEWKNSDPVKRADFYKSPVRPEEFMKYATTSGFDFVFLAKVTNKPKSNLD